MSERTIPLLDLSPELKEIAEPAMEAIRRVIDSGRFILGPEVESFEQEIARYLGVRNAIGVSSGTDALVIALRALGVGPGDEVITSPFTFIATAEAVTRVGATPVFVDIDPDTFNMSPAEVEKAITRRTKALLPVHLFGQPAAMDELETIAEHSALLVLEDCAQAAGAKHKGRRVGTLGAAAAFSFFPSKNLGAFGDAGLIATDNDAVAEAATVLRVHGARGQYHHEAHGYNARLDALQAAVLRVKLPQLDARNEQRRGIAKRYDEALSKLKGISTPKTTGGVEHVYHQYTLRVHNGQREAVRRKLTAGGVDSQVYYPYPLHQQPLYREPARSLPEAERAASEVLSLPLWPEMDDTTQDRVISALRAALS